MDTILGTKRSAAGVAGRETRGVAAALAAPFERVIVWLERNRQRRALLTLDDWLLKDIGLSRADVLREALKPFWRP